MPCFATGSRARILEGLELEPLNRNSDAASVREEALSVGRDEMRERPSLPYVPVEPEAAIHGVNHSFATRPEFAKWHLFRGRTDIA